MSLSAAHGFYSMSGQSTADNQPLDGALVALNRQADAVKPRKSINSRVNIFTYQEKGRALVNRLS